MCPVLFESNVHRCVWQLHGQIKLFHDYIFLGNAIENLSSLDSWLDSSTSDRVPTSKTTGQSSLYSILTTISWPKNTKTPQPETVETRWRPYFLKNTIPVRSTMRPTIFGKYLL